MFDVELFEDLVGDGIEEGILTPIVIVQQSGRNYLFGVPKGIMLYPGDKVLCDTSRGETEGVCVSHIMNAGEAGLDAWCKVLGAKLPLKMVVGKYQIDRF